ncbi:MAG: T9SS C-terminal target domain-containing protein [Sphingobacteriales bacterium]|nr:MAG: T9SS C-terminal target domain-containing protein [Sphingobacteriales bacterium]
MRTTLPLLATVLCILLATKNYAQQQLTFTYDAAGNQTERNLVCINCTPPAVASLAEDKLADLKPDSLGNTGRKFSAYPNPVTETLNIQWSSTDLYYIRLIEVFTLNGTRIYHKTYKSNQDQATISFLNLSSGIYLLRGIYNDDKHETVKVMKQ